MQAKSLRGCPQETCTEKAACQLLHSEKEPSRLHAEKHNAADIPWEHSPFVTINVAIGQLFEDGYAKEAARYFETAGSSFRTMLKKLPCRCMLKYQDKRGMLPYWQ